jgi:hypothetical protein
LSSTPSLSWCLVMGLRMLMRFLIAVGLTVVAVIIIGGLGIIVVIPGSRGAGVSAVGGGV